MIEQALDDAWNLRQSIEYDDDWRMLEASSISWKARSSSFTIA